MNVQDYWFSANIGMDCLATLGGIEHQLKKLKNHIFILLKKKKSSSCCLLQRSVEKNILINIKETRKIISSTQGK